MATLTTRHLILPEPPSDPEQMAEWIRQALYPALLAAFDHHFHQFPEVAEGQVRAKEYTDAAKPTAAEAGTGAIIFINDVSPSPGQFVMSDGTVWVDID